MPAAQKLEELPTTQNYDIWTRPDTPEGGYPSSCDSMSLQDQFFNDYQYSDRSDSERTPTPGMYYINSSRTSTPESYHHFSHRISSSSSDYSFNRSNFPSEMLPPIQNQKHIPRDSFYDSRPSTGPDSRPSTGTSGLSNITMRTHRSGPYGDSFRNTPVIDPVSGSKDTVRPISKQSKLSRESPTLKWSLDYAPDARVPAMHPLQMGPEVPRPPRSAQSPHRSSSRPGTSSTKNPVLSPIKSVSKSPSDVTGPGIPDSITTSGKSQSNLSSGKSQSNLSSGKSQSNLSSGKSQSNLASDKTNSTSTCAKTESGLGHSSGKPQSPCKTPDKSSISHKKLKSQTQSSQNTSRSYLDQPLKTLSPSRQQSIGSNSTLNNNTKLHPGSSVPFHGSNPHSPFDLGGSLPAHCSTPLSREQFMTPMSTTLPPQLSRHDFYY